jgi:hypothetical protein
MGIPNEIDGIHILPVVNGLRAQNIHLRTGESRCDDNKKDAETHNR